jgi:thiamine-phosphate pyrophosphorylase
MRSRNNLRADYQKALLNPGILAILDAGICPEIPRMVSTAKLLSQSGIRFFQLRAKGWKDSRVLAAAMELKSAVPGCVVTVNDRPDIAATAAVQGVHLGADDIPAGAARMIMGKGGIVGASAGNPRELRSALAGRPDYISFGPAFSTSTKRDAGRALGVAGFLRLRRLVPKGVPILAVGGITPDNVGVLIDAGADAVAVASWWWKRGSPERAAREMMEAVGAARKK